ncbi:hypothetical protein ACJX0J_016548 [Zea mays]
MTAFSFLLDPVSGIISVYFCWMLALNFWYNFCLGLLSNGAVLFIHIYTAANTGQQSMIITPHVWSKVGSFPSVYIVSFACIQFVSVYVSPINEKLTIFSSCLCLCFPNQVVSFLFPVLFRLA